MIDLEDVLLQMPVVPNETLERVSARPEDVESPDAIIDALWASYSAEAGQRDWSRLRSLFYPGLGTNIVVRPLGDRNELRILRDHEAYRSWSFQFLSRNNLYEWELGRRIQRFGNTAHVIAACGVGDEPGVPFGHAIQNILLMHDRTRWWVLTLLIDLITDENPLPEELLDRGR